MMLLSSLLATAAAAALDDPMQCGGVTSRYRQTRLSMGIDQLIRIEANVHQWCPDLAAAIRTRIAVLRAREAATRPPPAPPAPPPVPPPPRYEETPRYEPRYERPYVPPAPPPPSLPAQSPCNTRIIRWSGVAAGQITPSLLRFGNQNCIEAFYGGTMVIEIDLCDGAPVIVTGIAVERYAFANGRPWSSRVAVSYELIAPDGSVSLPQTMGYGYNRVRTARFPAQQAIGARIRLPSLLSRGYEIHERLCSITFQQ